MIDVEIYTPAGVLMGTTAHEPPTADGSDLVDALTVTAARWYPVDGSPPVQRDDVGVDPDDILLMVSPEPDLKVHMDWYSIVIEVGPYRVSGRLATHPGFDPARAMTRPGGTFVALSDVTIELCSSDDAGSAHRDYLLVNRYVVDRVTSSLMLGHFFPGARLVSQEAASPAHVAPVA